MLKRYLRSERGNIPLYMFLMMTFMYVAVFSFDYTRALAVNARLKSAVQSAALAGAATAQAVPVYDYIVTNNNGHLTITEQEIAVHSVINPAKADTAAANNFSQNISGVIQPQGYPSFQGLNGVVSPSGPVLTQTVKNQASWAGNVYTNQENPYPINPSTKQRIQNTDDSYWFAVNVLIAPVFLNGPLTQGMDPYLVPGPNGKKYIQATYPSQAQSYASIPGQGGP